MTIPTKPLIQKVNSGYPLLEAALAHIQEQQFNLFCSKQKDYGPRNISKFGESGILVRVSDKIERLINLSKQEIQPANETIDDTWTDISIYAQIALLVRNGKWPK